MLKGKNYEILNEFGSYIKEIYFTKIPQTCFLEALVENDATNDIIYHLPLGIATSWDEFAYSSISKNIYSVNFSTDLFIEIKELYHFSNLRNLALTCNNKNASYVDTDDINNLLHVLMNLEHLSLLFLNISKMKSQISENIYNTIKYSLYNVKVEMH